MRYALDIHPDDAALWERMTGRDETRPYEMPPLHNTDFMVASAKRGGVRILAIREIPEGES
jgi:hypothetical protein